MTATVMVTPSVAPVNVTTQVSLPVNVIEWEVLVAHGMVAVVVTTPIALVDGLTNAVVAILADESFVLWVVAV